MAIASLKPDLKTHVVRMVSKGVWSGTAVLELKLQALKETLRDNSPPLEEEWTYYNFIQNGGIIFLVTDGRLLVGAATVGRCSSLWSESFMVEDFCVAPRISVLTDQVYGAMLKGIVCFARLMAAGGEEMKPILIHLSAGDSKRRLLKRLFMEYGFQEESDAPGMWIARVSQKGQDQLAA
ncbi:MAG: hypothetical protein IPJ68_02375 [Candidatus Moraniibacteriota bacterium]|nr:MAG: hypothetical protein IPJ68_02375 [Candidatus Moranbacteria bacterium]